MERILIVDDDEYMRSSLQIELESDGFEVSVAENGTQAIEMAKNSAFDLILCDVRMPGLSGIETISAIRDVQPGTRSIIITGYASHDTPIAALRLRVDDYLMKPFSGEELLRSIRSTLVRLRQSVSQSEGVARYRRNFLKLITGILFEGKVSHLIGHSERVAHLALQVGRSLGLSPVRLQNLYIAALLHDVGYFDLPAQLMEKKEFRPEDFDLVKNHPALARDLLEPFKELKEIATVISYHHERWDGTGYPSALGGDMIPLESRIIAVAEAYDSLVSDRPHRSRKAVKEALGRIESGSGSYFDPRIVKLLPSVIEVYEEKPFSPAASETDDRERRTSVLLNLADIQREQKNLDVAWEAYEKALELLEGSEAHELKARGELGKVQVLSGRGLHEEALRKARDLIEYAKSHALSFVRAQAALQAGYSAMVLGQYEGVEGEILSAREIFEVWESAYHMCEADFLLSNLHCLRGDDRSPGSIAAFNSFLQAILSRRFFDILQKYPDFSTVFVRRLIRHSIEHGLLIGEITALFRDQKRAPLSILEGLANDEDRAVRLRVLDILNEARGREARIPAAEGRKDSADEAPAEAPGAAPPVRIFFFGKFRVMAGETPVDEEAWVTRKAKSLFAYLVSRGGEEVSEERLMDIFWLKGGQKALHSLHNSVSVIRKILTPFLGPLAKNIVLHRKASYYFNSALGCQVDVADFEELFHRGRTFFEQNRWDEGLASLQNAERLYMGDFMEGSYDEWSDELRLALRNRYIELLTLLGKYFFRKGKHEVSIDYWKKLLACDNCCEDAYIGLMLCYVAMDRKNEAVRAYRQCARTLQAELDLPVPAKAAEIYLHLMEGQTVPLTM
ncbi:MAG: response regulator [Candidatus Eremiobacteraeota bacterium]|nr:response regulator [Candidatus Eremiobacteraeota bacterium]